MLEVALTVEVKAWPLAMVVERVLPAVALAAFSSHPQWPLLTLVRTYQAVRAIYSDVGARVTAGHLREILTEIGGSRIRRLLRNSNSSLKWAILVNRKVSTPMFSNQGTEHEGR